MVCSRKEGCLDGIFVKVRRIAALIIIEFVIALPDDLTVFAVGIIILERTQKRDAKKQESRAKIRAISCKSEL